MPFWYVVARSRLRRFVSPCLAGMPSRDELTDEVTYALEETASNLLTQITALMAGERGMESLEMLGTVLDEEFRALTEQLQGILFLMRSPERSPPATMDGSSSESGDTGGTYDDVVHGAVLPLRRGRSRSPRRR